MKNSKKWDLKNCSQSPNSCDGVKTTVKGDVLKSGKFGRFFR